MKLWHVYILECSDDSLYTGVTNDIQSRLYKHMSKKGAKYTKSRGVKRLAYTEEFDTKSEAMKRESEIKSWDRTQKLELIEGK